MNNLNFTLEDILPNEQEIISFANMWQQGYEFKLEDLVKKEHEPLLEQYENVCNLNGVDAMDLFHSLLKAKLFHEAVKDLYVEGGE